ncbi:putative N6-adenine-specific DNA methylase [Candida maltosa Xu316]|uniref:Putative N6-adenine-specific DNA methylase n=1 Tax=Candida maltosa (strain Xu316) TaxID=1245528 RepID=M3JUM7_CANMX|nr:putative N6-adenine-specific DNA methylase [Candida maltosa Xu316]
MTHVIVFSTAPISEVSIHNWIPKKPYTNPESKTTCSEKLIPGLAENQTFIRNLKKKRKGKVGTDFSVTAKHESKEKPELNVTISSNVMR